MHAIRRHSSWQTKYAWHAHICAEHRPVVRSWILLAFMSFIVPAIVTIISSPAISSLRSSYTDIGAYPLTIVRHHTHDSPPVLYRSLDVRVSTYDRILSYSHLIRYFLLSRWESPYNLLCQADGRVVGNNYVCISNVREVMSQYTSLFTYCHTTAFSHAVCISVSLRSAIIHYFIWYYLQSVVRINIWSSLW